MALDAEQRSRLLASRLAALAARLDVGALDGAPSVVAGLTVARSGDVAVVGADSDRAERSLGPALAWTVSQGIGSLHLVVSDAAEAAAVLARRARWFSPEVVVWSASGDDVVVATPAPPPTVSDAPVAALGLTGVLVEAGADVVVEHGVVTGEVEGLEVARVVEGPEGWHLEVGVGRHDREAFAVVHGDEPTVEALARVVASVRRHRRSGEPHHPLNRMASERWLRRWLVDHPEVVGAQHLEPVESALPRTSLRDVVPAFATGSTPDGSTLVVGCSVGVDLDLVAEAADTRAARDPAAELVLAVPRRDVQPVTGRLAARLVAPARLVGVPDRWRA